MPGPGERRPRRREAPPEPASQVGTDFLAVGEIAAPHGVRGYFRVRILTDFPQRFKKLRQVYLGEEHRSCEVQAVRVLPDRVLMKIVGVDTPEAARPLGGQLVYVPVADAMPLGEGEYYWYQIIGLEVWTQSGQHLGKVTDILATGSNDVYIVQGDGREVLVPAIEDVIAEVDLVQGRLVITPLPGML
ncbi:MAG: ribosome maturation factor RimM [Chloroflexi bacterium]|nr:ribosome maturation factor RimM [Chloroflexota bacterium]MCL5108189.1 ribosome maturation factor RimM [Chloroflexota bacterium]